MTSHKGREAQVSAVRKLVWSAMFLALGLTLPFLTGHVLHLGAVFLPMHLPVLLCGMIVGGPWGFAVGLICPLLSSLLFGSPPFYPAAAAMTFELATYGLTSGLLYRFQKERGVIGIYVSLISAMLLGRVVWGICRWAMMAFGTEYTLTFLLTGAFVDSVPGIIVQLVVIPLIVTAVQKTRLNG